MLSNFVEHIEENIYNRELIYRSILVVKSNIETIRLKNLLDRKDYTCYIIEDIDNDLDYNNIDCRIMILCANQFKDFIQHIDNTIGINNSSYNFIGFNYTIDDDCVEDMVSYYLVKTNNNNINTLILDKKYSNHLHLLGNI